MLSWSSLSNLSHLEPLSLLHLFFLCCLQFPFLCSFSLRFSLSLFCFRHFPLFCPCHPPTAARREVHGCYWLFILDYIVVFTPSSFCCIAIVLHCAELVVSVFLVSLSLWFCSFRVCLLWFQFRGCRWVSGVWLVWLPLSLLAIRFVSYPLCLGSILCVCMRARVCVHVCACVCACACACICV